MGHINFPLTNSQMQIAQDPSRVRVLIAPRRYGKSTLLAALFLQTGISIKNGFSLLVNPYQSQSEKFFAQTLQRGKLVRKYLSRDPKLWPNPLLTFRKTNHEWDLRAFEQNPDSLLGGFLNFCALDESADFDNDTVMRVLMPRIMDRNGKMFVTGTVTTESSFLWQQYLKGQEGKFKDPDYKSWKMKLEDCVAFQNPDGSLNEQSVDFVRRNTPDWIWKTQFLCLPSSDNQTAFTRLKNCLIDDLPPPMPQPGRIYTAALDLGLVRDRCFLTIMDDTGLMVWAEQYIPGLTHDEYARKTKTICDLWRPRTLWIDATGAGGSGGQRTSLDSHVKVYQFHLGKLVKEHFFSGNSETQSKKQMVFNLMLMMEQKKIRIPKKFEILIKQLEGYRLIKNRVSVSWGCTDGNDDGVASTLLSSWYSSNVGGLAPELRAKLTEGY